MGDENEQTTTMEPAAEPSHTSRLIDEINQISARNAAADGGAAPEGADDDGHDDGEGAAPDAGEAPHRPGESDRAAEAHQALLARAQRLGLTEDELSDMGEVGVRTVERAVMSMARAMGYQPGEPGQQPGAAASPEGTPPEGAAPEAAPAQPGALTSAIAELEKLGAGEDDDFYDEEQLQLRDLYVSGLKAAAQEIAELRTHFQAEAEAKAQQDWDKLVQSDVGAAYEADLTPDGQARVARVMRSMVDALLGAGEEPPPVEELFDRALLMTFGPRASAPGRKKAERRSSHLSPKPRGRSTEPASPEQSEAQTVQELNNILRRTRR